MMQSHQPVRVPEHGYGDDVDHVLITEEQLHNRIAEMANRLSETYADEDDDLILVCVLKGAVYFITDISRQMSIPTQLEFMAVSSYGNATSSSGVVRILKDLDRDIQGRNVVIIEDVIDSGLTLHWLIKNLRSRKPSSLRIVTLLRKPDAIKVDIDLFDVGFDIPNEFVVGYGLDYAERYRDIPWVGTLKSRVYEK